MRQMRIRLMTIYLSVQRQTRLLLTAGFWYATSLVGEHLVGQPGHFNKEYADQDVFLWLYRLERDRQYSKSCVPKGQRDCRNNTLCTVLQPVLHTDEGGRTS